MVAPPGPLSLDAPDVLAILRDTLRGHDYTPLAIGKSLSVESPETIPTSIEVIAHLRRLTDTGPLGTLIRLLLLRDTVTESVARAAIAPLGVEDLVGIGLLERVEDGIRSAFSLFPYEDLYFVCDHVYRDDGPPAADVVTGVNRSSVILDQVTIRRPVATALDLGTGCGVQALLAARHAGHVVATDVNGRALNLTAFNARLNDVTNVECRQGSFFEPVAGERFDLIVTNPPFVISPENAFLFRDSGGRGDEVCRNVAKQFPDFLAERGFGHMLCNWVLQREAEWSAPLRGWLSGDTCDGLALLAGTDDPVSYAAAWLKAEYPYSPLEYRRALDEWLMYYQAEGIERIAMGVLLCRRRNAGQPWFVALPTLRAYVSSCGPQLARLFRIHDYLRSLPGPGALLDRPLRLVDEHYLDQTREVRDGRWVVTKSLLRLTRGLALEGIVGEAGLDFVAGCDGQTPMRELVRRFAERSATPLDETTVMCLRLVWQLMETGFLMPATSKTRSTSRSPRRAAGR